MIIDVIMPKMGESVTEGTILEWRKSVGDKIELDEILLEIGTDKVDSEIPSSASGIIVEILAKPNDVKEVGEVIAKINTNIDSTNEIEMTLNKESQDNDVEIPENTKTFKSSDDKSLKSSLGSNNKKFYTPVVMKIAAERELPLNELELIPGTGRGGRVTKKDILNYCESRDLQSTKIESSSISKNIPKVTKEILSSQTKSIIEPTSSGSTEEMGHMRKMIAENMRQSLDTSAHVYVMTDIDVTRIVDFVKQKSSNFLDREGFKLTYTPFIIYAVVKSLHDFPEMNSTLLGTSITYNNNINIGIAVSLDDGLMVPTIFNCEEKNFLGLCRSVNKIVDKTRKKQISIDELQGSTFTISNFGVFGVTVGTPIINQPNVGILGVGAVKKKPVVIESDLDDSIAIRSIMAISLGFDHRLIDGSGGAQFIQQLKFYLETIDLEKIL
tara:strand:+ start:649 stop:1971 length:1323 start_codon:yes stop_codon:yes gene_type:complete